MILTPLQNLPRNVGDLGKSIAAKGFKKFPKVQKSPNLVTLNTGAIGLLPNLKMCLVRMLYSPIPPSDGLH